MARSEAVQFDTFSCATEFISHRGWYYAIESPVKVGRFRPSYLFRAYEDRDPSGVT